MVDSPKKIDLCIVLHAPLGGGAERFMIHLVRNLSREIFNIYFILLNAQGEYAGLIPQDIKIIDLKMPPLKANETIHFKWILKLANIFRQLRPQVIFSTLSFVNVLTVLAKILSGIKAAVIIRETTLMTNNFSNQFRSQVRKRIFRYFYGRADLIVAPSESVLIDLKDNIGIQNKNMQYMPNFIDPLFLETKLHESLDKESYKLKFDRPILISMGQLHYQKGFDLVLKALRDVLAEYPCYYWILGKGEKEEELKKLTKDLGIAENVLFLGFQKNPYIFLKHANIFLLPSRCEGFSNALLEAMYLGVPCIATKYDSTIEKFFENQKNGLLAEVENSLSISEAIKKLLQDNSFAREIGMNGKEKTAGLTVKNVIKQYEDLLISHTNRIQ